MALKDISNEDGDVTVGSIVNQDGNNHGSIRAKVNGEYHITEIEHDLKDQQPTPIVVVGMAMRLPGGVKTDKDFWDFLTSKKDGRSKVPESRYNSDGFSDGSKRPGIISTQYGYFIDQDLRSFDAEFFGIPRGELAVLDPRQRLLLEVIWECMESAGQVAWQGENIGCYVGSFADDWGELRQRDTQILGPSDSLSTSDFILANRTSHQFDLKGPSLAVKTACSSSTVALHMACQGIRNGDCDSAIVAGVNLILSPTSGVILSQIGALSVSGSCKTFDAAADGYARGEAVTAIYIKRLPAALRDNDPIRGVIRGTMVNADGRTPGMSTPSAEAYERLIRSTYRMAGISDIFQTGFFECHGTGTPIGDPIEVEAVAKVFGKKGILIGSMKPNFGHSEAAAGLTGLIKALLCLEHKSIPPNINFNSPNPKIPFEAAKLQVPTETMQWPMDRKERASVNCSGLGGVNAHVIVESASEYRPKCDVGESTEEREAAGLLVVSANDMTALAERVQLMRDYLSNTPHNFTDIAYTLGQRREHMKFRAFFTGTRKSLIAPSDSMRTPQNSPNLVFVYTGQGAQWPGMGKELLSVCVAFRQSLVQLDRFLQELPDAPTWSICGILSETDGPMDIDDPELAQPLSTAVQIGLTDVLQNWSIVPTAVVGHSSGELAAAYAAGCLSARAAIVLAFYRGKVMQSLSRNGAMAAIGLGSHDTRPYLVDGVTIACENSPESTTISGDCNKVDEILARIQESTPETFCRRLRVKVAYHSYHMKKIGAAYQASITSHIERGHGNRPFYSSVTGTIIPGPKPLEATYWQNNLESPVIFSTAVQQILQDYSSSNSVFIEVGPHSALSGPLRQILTAHSSDSSPRSRYIPSMVRSQSPMSCLLSLAGNIWALGIDIDFAQINGKGTVVTDLPQYPWQHKIQYWEESPITQRWRKSSFVRHELLGTRNPECSDYEPSWRNIIRLEDVPWLQDHMVEKQIVFPATGYIATAGEAIRQITNMLGYTVRNFVIKAALLLSYSSNTEIITNLSPVRLTDRLDSSWFHFGISSYDGHKWITHCSGEIRGGEELSLTERKVQEFAHSVPQGSLYSTRSTAGINYGPFFKGLDHVSVNRIQRRASATLVPSTSLDHTMYALHPVCMDHVLQLFCLAANGGLMADMTAVPEFIEQISIKPGYDILHLEACGAIRDDGTPFGIEAWAVTDGKPVLQYKGLRTRFLSRADSNEEWENLQAMELIWKPHIDVTTPDKAIKRIEHRDTILSIEKFALRCIFESAPRLSVMDRNTYPDHLKRYGDWLISTATRIKQNKHPMSPLAREIFGNDGEDDRLKENNTLSSIKALALIFDNLESIFDGTVDPLELLTESGVWAGIYADFQAFVELEPYFESYGHSRPRMRILEIGAGSGGITAAVLKALSPHAGCPLYSQYTFTDISSGFFPDAKERFRIFKRLEFKTLDITKDPLDQGFSEGSYDLIIAANALHVTPSLEISLGNVRKLLAPGGHLFLQELCTEMTSISYVMGVLPGWWIGIPDGRVSAPYIRPELWDEELRKAGFNGVEAVMYDDERPYQANAYFISSVPEQPSASSKKVTLLYQGDKAKEATAIADHLTSVGYLLTWCSLGEPLPSGQIVISLLDLNGPYLHDGRSEDWEHIRNLVSKDCTAPILWVTKMCQAHCIEPAYSLIVGFARCVRSELLVNFSTLEVASFHDAQTHEAIVTVLDLMEQSEDDHEMDEKQHEYEFILINDSLHVGRYYPSQHTDQICSSSSDGVDSPKSLSIQQYGLFDTLSWTESDISALEQDEVEVTVSYAGMNYKDILIAMGLVEGSKDKFGLEGSGIVHKIGPGVSKVKPGDRVIFQPVSKSAQVGACSTRLVLSEDSCVHIPDSLSLAEAATMPVTFCTVIYSLIYCARLEKGQSVLIHSASGGVGQAAIQICRMLGAEIYTTVGTQEKKSFLMDTFGIPADRIFHSRDTSFHPALMEKTNGAGVDVVLNSLAGELLHASWKCVADCGTMIELGKSDFLGHATLSMSEFENNRSFFGVDLAQLIERRPGLNTKILGECMGWYEAGKIKPLASVTIYSAAETKEAFRFMQRGRHIEKKFRPDVAYLLVGGLGGIGRLLSTWMVENGARNFVYISPNADSEKHQPFIDELQSLGCKILAVKGNVANEEDIKRLISLTAYPIAGIMQLSMILEDVAIDRMTFDDWQRVVSPKVRGTWNLHRAFKEVALDFFVLFSSVSAVYGTPGQANYAAANMFLDAFVQYRHGLGLSASVINLGRMGGVGYVSENSEASRRMDAMKFPTLYETDLLNAMKLSISCHPPVLQRGIGYAASGQLTIGLKPKNNNGGHYLKPNDAQFSILLDSSITGNEFDSNSQSGLRALIDSAASDPTILDSPESLKILTTEISNAVSSILSIPADEMDVTRPVSSLGLDSLVSIEIRKWWKRSLGVDITVLEIEKVGSIEQLAAFAAQSLKDKYGPAKKETEELRDQ